MEGARKSASTAMRIRQLRMESLHRRSGARRGATGGEGALKTYKWAGPTLTRRRTMGKPTVARALDPFRYHDVTLALRKANAMASVLIDLGPEADNDLVDALRDGSHPEETLEWLPLRRQ